MGTDASPPNPAPLGAPNSSGIHTKLTFDGSSKGKNTKITNPLFFGAPFPKPHTPSLQADVATLKEEKSTLRIHAYYRAEVIKPGTYSRSLLRSAKVQKLDCT